MAHRDLHGTNYQPGPTQVILVLLLISKAASSQASKEVQSNKYEHDKQDDI